MCVPNVTGPPNSEHFFKDMKMIRVLRRFFPVKSGRRGEAVITDPVGEKGEAGRKDRM